MNVDRNPSAADEMGIADQMGSPFFTALLQQARRLQKVEIHDENKENLTQVGQRLKAKSGVALVAGHTSMMDQFTATEHLFQLLSLTPQQLHWVVSIKFMPWLLNLGLPEDKQVHPPIPPEAKPLHPMVLWMFQQMAGQTFQPLVVVQTYLKSLLNPNLRERCDELNSDFFTRSKRILSDPGNMVAMFPEGTRNQKPGLLRAEGGAINLAHTSGAFFWPVALHNVLHLPSNLRQPAHIVTLPPISLIDAQAEAKKLAWRSSVHEQLVATDQKKTEKTEKFHAVDFCMYLLALKLIEVTGNEQNAGVYHPDNITNRVPNTRRDNEAEKVVTDES